MTVPERLTVGRKRTVAVNNEKKCRECRLTFATRKSLHQHRRRKHQISAQPSQRARSSVQKMEFDSIAGIV